MKVQIEGKEVRIIGENVGKKRHLRIYVTEENGRDTYSLSIIKDGFEIGCLDSVNMDKDYVVVGAGSNKRFVE